MSAAAAHHDSAAVAAEELAARVVQCFQQCMEHLRSIEAFSAGTTRTTITKSSSSSSNDKKETATASSSCSLKDLNLFTTMVDAGLHQQVRETCLAVRNATTLTTTPSTSSPEREDDLVVALARHDDNDVHGDDQRFQLVHQILLPLMDALWRCYRFLDRLPAPQSPPSPSQSDDRNTKKKSKQAPIPPVGMLSIQNYTDVACLLELLVCSSILPLLEQNVLATVEQRARYLLPKSLAGRLPRKSLLWATTAIGTCRHDDDDAKQRTQQQHAQELWLVSTVMSHLVMLDRFRPMLLPRHLPDLYAAVFQCEHYYYLQQQQQQQQSRCLTKPGDTSSTTTTTSQKVLPTELLCIDTASSCSSKAASVIGTTTTTSRKVDSILQARAYQTLLLQGTAAPAWLRKRVSGLLGDLACQDLFAIIQVFVLDASASSPSKDPSAAGLRLARAIAAGSSSSSSHQQTSRRRKDYDMQICQQVVKLLDATGAEYESIQSLQMKGLNSQQVSTMHTIWATLDLLPLQVLEEHFLFGIKEEFIMSGKQGFQESSTVAHLTVKRFGVLLSCFPPFVNTAKVCQLLLSQLSLLQLDSDSAKPNLLGVFVRLAAMPSVEVSQVKSDATWTLRVFVQAMCSASFKASDGTPTAGVDLLAMALVFSLAPCCWDLDGLQFREDSETTREGGLKAIKLVKNDVVGDSLVSVAQGIEQRALVVTRDVLAPLAERTTSDNDSENTLTDNESSLIHKVFLTLLAMCFASGGGGQSNAKDGFLFSTLLNEDIFQIVPLVSLPVLCEQCKPEALLRSSGEDFGFFEMMKLVFYSAAARFGLNSSTGESESDRQHDKQVDANILQQSKERLTQTGDFFASVFLRTTSALGPTIASHTKDAPANDELLWSVCSILLSLLIGMLELGSGKRSEREEETLQSFSTVLGLLSKTSIDVDEEGSGSSVPSEISEMAAHAVALIAARRVPRLAGAEVGEGDERRFPPQEPQDILSQAELDLESDEPPMRARGVVALRHLAGALGGNDMADTTTLLHVVDTSSACDDSMLWHILRLAVKSLADSESYVYLAAIQTIAMIADTRPADTVSAVGLAVASGDLRCSDGIDNRLSLEQRVKLTEALIAIVRRKAAINEYIESLIDMMVFGGDMVAAGSYDSDDAKRIQKETHEYFMHGLDPGDEAKELITQKEKWESIDTRVKAPPLIQSEESDAVRACKITILAELVSVAHPSVIARHSAILLGCAINAIRLDVSRPMRRAGAGLAKALYRALAREQEETLESENSKQNHSIPLAIGMVSAHEDVLANALERCVNASDLQDLKAEKERHYDPASVARCQEALAIRKDCEDGGILMAGQLALDTRRLDELLPISRTLGELSGGDESRASLLGSRKRIEEL